MMLKLLIPFFALLFIPTMGHPDQVESFMRKEMQQKNIPGAAVVVIKEGKSSYYNFGVTELTTRRPVKDDTLFELASITKVFTATVIAFEVLNGRMDLNESIVSYVPALKMESIKEIKNVTLLDLLTHTSGLPRVAPSIQGKTTEQEDLIKFLQEWDPEKSREGKYQYSNLGYGLLGIALEGERGEALGDVFEELILEPLGMKSTSLQIQHSLSERYAFGYSKRGARIPPIPFKLMPASGGLRSSARDMERFLSANMGLSGPENLIKAMKFARDPRFKVNSNLSLGLGWQNTLLNNARLVEKNGGLNGSSAYIGFLPEQGIGVVLMANKADIDSTSLGRSLLKLLYPEKVKP